MNRYKLLFALFVFCIAALILRLGSLQLIYSQKIQTGLYDQRYKQYLLYKEKGDILDRNRIPLTASSVETVLIMNYDTYVDNNELFNEIDNYIFLSLSPDNPVIIRTTEQEGKRIKEALKDECRILRVKNTNPSLAKHVIGYRSGYNQEGIAGLLKAYDDILDCDTGILYSVLQDINGNVIFDSEPSITVKGDRYHPHHVVLTLDIHYQRIVEDYLKETGKKGCVILQDCNTGYVLAMASAPDYTVDYSGEFLKGENGELLNRAVCEYNPGSIVKAVIAAVILESFDTRDFDLHCNGFYRFQGRTIQCSAHDFDRERAVDLPEAFAVSCNSYFINAARKIGYEKIYLKAVELGLTKETGLPQETGEKKGYLPEPEEVKSDIDLANLVLGQWVFKVTPIQICNLTSAVANGGMLNRVNLVLGVVNDKGQKILDLTDKHGERVISRNAAKRLAGIMERCVKSGTGKLSDPGNMIGVGGKTGTAGEQEGHNTVWFTGFFPVSNPKFAMTVLLEDATSGASDAAPLFGKIAAEIINQK